MGLEFSLNTSHEMSSCQGFHQEAVEQQSQVDEPSTKI